MNSNKDCRVILNMALVVFVHLINVSYVLGGIKASLEPFPAIVKFGEHSALRCLYELNGAPLYSVKWYRGPHEFYRYTPDETPQKRVFASPGLHVDLSLSNETQVMLRKLEFSMSGKFSCEVSADAPSFSTAVDTSNIDVVFPPETGPRIHTERNQYRSGDLLRANCTAPPSKPAANLTFLINNQVLSLATRHVHDAKDGLEWSDVTVSVLLTTSYFRSGRMTLRCLAQLYPYYAESDLMTFVSMSDPVPERITSPSSASTNQINLLKWTIILITIFVLSKAQDYDNLFYDYVDPDSHPLNVEEVENSLIGL